MKGNKFLAFMKKNAFYFVLGFCLLAIALSFTIYAVGQNDRTPIDSGNEKPIEPDDPVNPDTPVVPDDPVKPSEPSEPSEPSQPTIVEVTFGIPVENGTVTKGYSADRHVFNQTLNRYEVHLGIDFGGADGAKVYAAYGGKIESIETKYLTGTTIVVDHGNNLKTVYNSLTADESLTVGQEVQKGQTLGTISATNLQEYKDGAHLHFQTMENGAYINPEKYLELEEK